MLTLALASGFGIQNNMLYAAKKAPLTWLGKCGCFCRCDMKLKQLWFWAVQNNRLTIVKTLIKLGFDVDSRSGDGRTALMLAISRGRLNLIKLFINAHANLNLRNAAGDPVLMQIFGYLPMHKDEIAQMLLAARANPDAQNAAGATALMRAAAMREPGVIRFLLEAGARLDVQALNGFTPLTYSIAIGSHIDIIRTLIDASLSKFMRFMSHVAREFPEAPLEFCEHVVGPFINPLGIQDGAGHDACWHVRNSDYLTPAEKENILKKLKPEQHDCHAHKSPLALALEAGDFETVRYLIEKGADFSPEQNNGHDVRRLFMQRVRLLESINMRHRPVRNAHSVCGICRDNNDGTSLFFEPCGHCFHKTCAENYLKVKRECPICHTGIRIISQQNLSAEDDEKKDA